MFLEWEKQYSFGGVCFVWKQEECVCVCVCVCVCGVETDLDKLV